MPIIGVDAVTFGVDDMAEPRRFLDDWGLTPVSREADLLSYQTIDGTQVLVRLKDAPGLPAPIEPGNTVREVIWGLSDQAALDALVAKLEIAIGEDGVARMIDPNGLGIGFRVSRRHKVERAATPVNGPGVPMRINAPSPVHDHAEPVKIGHVVVFADDFAAMKKFYTEKVGFVVSDEYPGHGVFMRCQMRGDHHNLFVLNRPGKPGVNHVAFTVRDIHEVIGGGIAMSKKGWKTEIGPGRHPISSAYFWYFHNPLGSPLEYYADDDYCTEDWTPHTYERKPELFAEWAIAGGIDGTTRRQRAEVDNSGRGHA
jgi:catechol 2,3-dioxygenase-like lactoylglutathione lyase family enzyme